MQSQAGYLDFVSALQAVLDLRDSYPNDVKWVGVKPNSFDSTSPSSFELTISPSHPNLAVALHPKADGKPITGYYTYHAPIILTDVQRWGLVADSLGRYAVDRWSGVPEEREVFQKQRSLSEIIGTLGISESVTDATPVVEVAVLLPIAPNMEFATEFVPTIAFSPSQHSHYKVLVISQNMLSAYFALTGGRLTTEIKDINSQQKMFNWSADSVPDLSALEKLLLHSSAGHMVLIATPVEAPRSILSSYDLPEFGSGGDRYLGGQMKGSPTLYGGSPTRGVSISAARIGRGSEAGQGSLYGGQLATSQKGGSAIYHLRVFCVKPDEAINLTAGQLTGLAKSVSVHPKT
ncbi:hypothetical protein HYU17_01240 [Candidatus Woesearchaeota archaeon]|nr:hypothetical protein [Candidatus Woesearchaeota archaeon]